jgi:hypothetical protein
MSKGAVLTGKMEGGHGGPVEIADGKSEGNNISFKVIREFQRQKQTLEWKGMLKGDDLMLEIQTESGPFQLNYKKK